MDRRLEHEALSNAALRDEWARELERRGDVRGSLLRQSITPSRETWFSLLDCFQEDVPRGQHASVAAWLRPYLEHWDPAMRVAHHPDVWEISLHNPRWWQAALICTTITLRYSRDVDYSRLARLTHVTSLDVSRSLIEDLTPLASLSKLTHLCLDQTRVADLEPLRQLSQLRALSIDETRVTDLRPLDALKHLPMLTAWDTPIENHGRFVPLFGWMVDGDRVGRGRRASQTSDDWDLSDDDLFADLDDDEIMPVTERRRKPLRRRPSRFAALIARWRKRLRPVRTTRLGVNFLADPRNS